MAKRQGQRHQDSRQAQREAHERQDVPAVHSVVRGDSGRSFLHHGIHHVQNLPSMRSGAEACVQGHHQQHCWREAVEQRDDDRTAHAGA